MQINRDNVKWAAKMMAIILLIAVADGLVVHFVRKPFPWVVLIPCLLPILMNIFVIAPMLKAQKAVPPSA